MKLVRSEGNFREIRVSAPRIFRNAPHRLTPLQKGRTINVSRFAERCDLCKLLHSKVDINVVVCVGELEPNPRYDDKFPTTLAILRAIQFAFVHLSSVIACDCAMRG